MCENPGEPWPSVADAHGHSRLDDEETARLVLSKFFNAFI